MSFSRGKSTTWGRTGSAVRSQTRLVRSSLRVTPCSVDLNGKATNGRVGSSEGMTTARCRPAQAQCDW